ncbi:hypothetical protein Tco_1327128 [Tanacetum coccineum]
MEQRSVVTDGEELLHGVDQHMKTLISDGGSSGSQPHMATRGSSGVQEQGFNSYLLPTEGNCDAVVFNIVPNVLNVAEIFGVPFETFADIEDLMNGIEIGKHEVLWSGMTNERRKDFIDYMFTTWKRLMDENFSVASNVGNNGEGTTASLGYPSLETLRHQAFAIGMSPSPGTFYATNTSFGESFHTSTMNPSIVSVDQIVGDATSFSEVNAPNVQTHNNDVVANLFGVSLTTCKLIDDFTKDLESGKYAVWSKLLDGVLDDLIEYGWSDLRPEAQDGVKHATLHYNSGLYCLVPHNG